LIFDSSAAADVVPHRSLRFRPASQYLFVSPPPPLDKPLPAPPQIPGNSDRSSHNPAPPLPARSNETIPNCVNPPGGSRVEGRHRQQSSPFRKLIPPQTAATTAAFPNSPQRQLTERNEFLVSNSSASASRFARCDIRRPRQPDHPERMKQIEYTGSDAP